MNTPNCQVVISHELTARLEDDPWSVPVEERNMLAEAMRAAQDQWLPRINMLIEPPLAAGNFPAWLLETPNFACLREAIGDAQTANELDVAAADQLQRFVDCYRDYQG